LSRPRLNAALNDLLDYPFTLISAPAGYGKTCLMVDLAHQASHPVCWYSIDPLDKDPKRFLAHLIHAIRKEFPEFGQTSLGLLYTLNDPLSSPDQFVSTLVNEIFSSISENFAIFLDDFHLLDDSEEINGFISRFGQQMDENTHMVISSRNQFIFPDLSLLIGRKLVKGIDQNDLAFQPQELKAYFQQTNQQPLSTEESQQMIENSAGWITGLLLSKDSKTGLLPEQDKASRITGTDLHGYFTSQVFEIQPEPIRTLMLRTSLFDEFNRAFCEEVLGEPEDIKYDEFLSVLTSQNLFIEQITDNGVWVRYHHLFRDFLRCELNKQIPDEKQRILARLLQVHLNSQDWEKAFEVSCRLKDPAAMANVIDAAFSPLFHAGRIKLLADWLEILPEEGFQSFPILYSLKGFSKTELGNPTEGLLDINKAIKLKDISSNHFLKYRTLIWRSTANRFLGNYSEGINDSLEVIEHSSDYMKYNSVRAEACREVGLGYGRIGNYVKALEYLKKSVTIYENDSNSNNVAQVRMDIGLVLMNIGNFKEAENFFLSSIPQWSTQGNNIQLSMLMNNLGFLSILTGNYIEAANWFNKGEKHAKLSSSKRLQAFISASRGDLYLSMNDYLLGLRYLDNALDMANEIHDSFLSVYIPITKATCLRCAGSTSEAEAIMLKLQESINKSASRYEQGLWFLEWGFLHLILKKVDIAKESFDEAHNIFNSTMRAYDLAKSLLGLCLTSLDQGNQIALIENGHELSNVISSLETNKPLLPEFSRHTKELRQISSRLPDLEIFKDLGHEISRYQEELSGLQDEIYPQAIESSTDTILDIQAFGEIHVKRNGKKLRTSEWIHQKTAREIFFFILTHPKGVTKEEVGLAFWPDSSPSQLSCQFKNAMYRLRRAIGKEAILFDQEARRYIFNWDHPHEYDVENFQDAINRADRQLDIDQRNKDLQKAVEIYQHPFAPQLEGTWSETLRRKFYLMYEKAQLEIATCALKTNKYTVCLDACQSILQIEPCQEKAYQLSMKAHSELNNTTEIHRVFILCKDNFAKILGIRPSNFTVNLYKDLTTE
jgi:two-component SAPR family response regulator